MGYNKVLKEGDIMKTKGLGKKIRTYRKAKRMTLKDLAELVDTSVSFLSDIERGRSNPSINRLTRIAEALEVPVSSLVNDYNRNNKIAEDSKMNFYDVSNLPADAKKELDLFIEFLKFKFL